MMYPEPVSGVCIKVKKMKVEKFSKSLGGMGGRGSNGKILKYHQKREKACFSGKKSHWHMIWRIPNPFQGSAKK